MEPVQNLSLDQIDLNDMAFWMRPYAEYGVVNNRATEKTHGAHAPRWNVETVVARGYATATAYYGDTRAGSPTITAAATVLVLISTLLLVTVELLRRRSERLRGVRN